MRFSNFSFCQWEEQTGRSVKEDVSLTSSVVTLPALQHTPFQAMCNSFCSLKRKHFVTRAKGGQTERMQKKVKPKAGAHTHTHTKGQEKWQRHYNAISFWKGLRSLLLPLPTGKQRSKEIFSCLPSPFPPFFTTTEAFLLLFGASSTVSRMSGENRATYFSTAACVCVCVSSFIDSNIWRSTKRGGVRVRDGGGKKTFVVQQRAAGTGTGGGGGFA